MPTLGKLPEARARLLLFVLLVALAAAGGAVAQEEEDRQASVTFHDQTTDGSEVQIASVTTSHGGFVVVHNTKLYTGPVEQSVAGVSQKLAAGTHENVSVPLEPAIEESQTLIAMPHVDSDDDGEFRYFETGRSEDWAYQDESGGAVTDEGEVGVEAENRPPSPSLAVVVSLLCGAAAFFRPG